MNDAKIYDDYFQLKQKLQDNEKRIEELEKIIRQQQNNRKHPLMEKYNHIYWTLQKIKIIIIVLFYFFGKQLLLNKEFYKLFVSCLSLLSPFK